jgi:hypothetical protein
VLERVKNRELKEKKKSSEHAHSVSLLSASSSASRKDKRKIQYLLLTCPVIETRHHEL